MENKIEEIFDKAKDIKLDSSEKEKMKGALLSHMKTHQPARRFSIFDNLFIPAPAIAAVLIIVMAGGVSWAAEGAMPGDFLYPIKVGINEEVKVLAARSDEEKLNKLVSLAEKRVEETEKLASEGKLDAHAQAKIESNFDARAAKIQEKLETINKEGKTSVAADVTSRFEASLNAHEQILEKLAERDSKSKEEIFSVIGKIKKVSRNTKTARQNYENEVVAKENGRLEQATQVRLSASLKAIQEAKNALAKSNSIDPEVRARAEEYIAQAENIVALVQDQDQAPPEAAARSDTMSFMAAQPDPLHLLHEAVKLSNQAELMVDAELRLNLKVTDFNVEGEVESESTSTQETSGSTSTDKESNKEEKEQVPPSTDSTGSPRVIDILP